LAKTVKIITQWQEILAKGTHWQAKSRTQTKTSTCRYRYCQLQLQQLMCN